MNKQKLKFKIVLIWTLLKGKYHFSLSKEEKKLNSFISILTALFPGINFYSISGFCSVLQKHGKPALKKLYPEIGKMKENEISTKKTISIKPFLKSNGYEWEDDPQWEKEFKKKLKNKQINKP